MHVFDPLDQTLPEVTEVRELSLALFPLDLFFRDLVQHVNRAKPTTRKKPILLA